MIQWCRVGTVHIPCLYNLYIYIIYYIYYIYYILYIYIIQCVTWLAPLTWLAFNNNRTKVLAKEEGTDETQGPAGGRVRTVLVANHGKQKEFTTHLRSVDPIRNEVVAEPYKFEKYESN